MSPAVVDLSDDVLEALQHAERWCSLGDVLALLGPRSWLCSLAEIRQALEILEKGEQAERRGGGVSNGLLVQWRAIFENR